MFSNYKQFLFPISTNYLFKIDSTGYNVKTCYYCQGMRSPEINHFQIAATVANCKIPGDIIVRVRREEKRERERRLSSVLSERQPDLDPWVSEGVNLLVFSPITKTQAKSETWGNLDKNKPAKVRSLMDVRTYRRLHLHPALSAL